jgi:hypothetical protein
MTPSDGLQVISNAVFTVPSSRDCRHYLANQTRALWGLDMIGVLCCLTCRTQHIFKSFSSYRKHSVINHTKSKNILFKA